MNNIVIGILGQNLDNTGYGKRRWLRWRPTLSILMQHDFQVDELILLHHKDDQALADLTMKDANSVCLNIKVSTHLLTYQDPWDFEQVYSQLHDFSQTYAFDPEHNNYYFNITTGTHVAQICIYLLTESNYFPGQLIQSSPSKEGPHGKLHTIDLDLSRYDQIASRFQRESQLGISHLKSGIETRNKAYNQLINEIENVAIRSTAPILLTGPTGVGKSQLAKKNLRVKTTTVSTGGKFNRSKLRDFARRQCDVSSFRAYQGRFYRCIIKP